MAVLSSFFCDLQQDNCYFTICNSFIDNAIYLLSYSFGPCFPRVVFHRISAVAVASLSFAALLPDLVLRLKQRSYCSNIQSIFCLLSCRTSIDSCKVNTIWKPDSDGGSVSETYIFITKNFLS